MSDKMTNHPFFPCRVEIPVQWGDMDAAGHVSNIIFLRWFESGRIEYFRRLGYDVVADQAGSAGFILAWQDCKYLAPVFFPDTVEVDVRVEDIMTDRFRMYCHIRSREQDRLVAIANCTMVTFDYHHRQKMIVPTDLRRKVEEAEASDR